MGWGLWVNQHSYKKSRHCLNLFSTYLFRGGFLSNNNRYLNFMTSDWFIVINAKPLFTYLHLVATTNVITLSYLSESLPES